MLVSVVVFLLASGSATAAPEWTLAEPGDRVTLVKRSTHASTYFVVKRGSVPGDFLLVSGNQAARVYQMFVGATRRLIILDAGSRVTLADGTGRPVGGSMFETPELERELRIQTRAALARRGAVLRLEQLASPSSAP